MKHHDLMSILVPGEPELLLFDIIKVLHDNGNAIKSNIFPWEGVWRLMFCRSSFRHVACDCAFDRVFACKLPAFFFFIVRCGSAAGRRVQAGRLFTPSSIDKGFCFLFFYKVHKTIQFLYLNLQLLSSPALKKGCASSPARSHSAL